MKPFLKWPGGKYRQVGRISRQLNGGSRLVEPFVGSGAVFLNTHYQQYLLADSNPDLINLYWLLQQEGKEFIEYCRRFFPGDTIILMRTMTCATALIKAIIYA